MITLRCGHGAVGDRVDHHRAVLDDPALLVLLADHVAGGVVQEEQRGVDLVGELDELRRLLRLLAEQHALGVGEDADRAAVEPRPAGDQRGAVERLELVERPPLPRLVPSTIRAITSRGSNGSLRSVGIRSSSPSGSASRLGERAWTHRAARAVEALAALRQFSRATIRRPIRIASCSSSAR